MELEYYKVEKQQKGPFTCPYNEACRCSQMRCKACGWNPEVAQKRSAKILKNHGVEA